MSKQPPMTPIVRGVLNRPNTTAAQATEAFTDLAAYPILTEQVTYPRSAPATSAGRGAGSGASLGQIVKSAVADVLGWKVRTDDPKGFIGALTQSFILNDVNGHVESKWVPRTYAVETDLSGGISGAQASLYSRAREALDQSLPLLDGLYALDPEADQEFVTAVREIVRDQMSELVNELAFAGGPRLSRINQYFMLLLGIAIQPNAMVQSDPDSIGGSLGNLRTLYGISTLNGGKPNPLINTIKDEEDATNFRVLADYFTSLAQSWANNLQFFGLNGKAKPFFGTQLVLISRQLSVSVELVDEVRFAMDSVFIGPAERQTLQIDFSNAPSIFMEDLLAWVERFASEEGPNLIQTGGKFGVGQVVQVLGTLQALVSGATAPANARVITQAYFTPRVQRAMQALASQLKELISVAGSVATTTLVSEIS